MKASKVFLPLIIVAVLALSWFTFFTGSLKTFSDNSKYMNEAEESMDARLYEQAIEFYKKALGEKKRVSVYEKIKDAYDALYAEEPTSYIRNCYIDDMEAACSDFPKEEQFWVAQINLYEDASNHSKAYATVVKARNYGAEGKELDALYLKLLYMTKVEYKLYTDCMTALNGYITVNDGSGWTVLDGEGKAYSSKYNLIGLINDEGMGIYVNSIDTRLLDSDEVTRARSNTEMQRAGYYNQKSDLVPVLIGETWRYMHADGTLLPGEYETAGSFYDGEAAAKTANGWVLVSENGSAKAINGFEDVKLDLYGCHIQGDVVIAKQNGKYHLYSTDFKQIGDFSADDIDICIDNGLIAFEQNGKWGFVNTDGKVKVEPTYACAKSFANGYAAVDTGSGLWGYIREDLTLVIDCTFMDAFYFNPDETCIVSNAEGTYQIMYFMFD